MKTLRASHVFICGDVFIDEKRVGGHGTYMRVPIELTCKDVLAIFMCSHAPDYSPVPDETIVTLTCQVLANTVHGFQPRLLCNRGYNDIVVVAFVVFVAAHVAHDVVIVAAGTSRHGSR